MALGTRKAIKFSQKSDSVKEDCPLGVKAFDLQDQISVQEKSLCESNVAHQPLFVTNESMYATSLVLLTYIETFSLRMKKWTVLSSFIEGSCFLDID